MAQDSLGELVTEEIGATMPLEARLWLALFDARSIHVAVGGEKWR